MTDDFVGMVTYVKASIPILTHETISPFYLCGSLLISHSVLVKLIYTDEIKLVSVMFPFRTKSNENNLCSFRCGIRYDLSDLVLPRHLEKLKHLKGNARVFSPPSPSL